MGIFNGLGGGVGPRLTEIEGAGISEFASFPAPSIGGGALNLNVRSGSSGSSGADDFGDSVETSVRLLRAGGIAGGGPLFDGRVFPVL